MGARLATLLLAAALVAPGPARALDRPGCSGVWVKGGTAACNFTYLGGEVFIVATGLESLRGSSPGFPLGPDVAVVAEVVDPLQPGFVLLTCSGIGGDVGGIALPAACVDGAPALLSVPAGGTLVCRARGSTHGTFHCISNNL